MRIASIESARSLGLLAVIIIHSSPFANPFDPSLWPEAHHIWLSGLLNQLARFAVPFFFLGAGFFLQPRLAGPAPLAAAWRYIRPLLSLWLLWSLVYVLVPFDPLAAWQGGYLAAMQFQWQMLIGDPLNQFWVGGMVHLWFLPALALAVLINAGLHAWQRPGWALVLGGGLYLLALLGGSYAKPLLGEEWALLTRNGPFFSLLYVSLGIAIRQHGWQLSARPALWLMLLGLGVHLLEAAMLYLGWQVPLARHDFLLGTVPWSLGLFFWLLGNPQWGRASLAERLASRVLGLYCVHMLVVIWIYPLGTWLHAAWWELLKPLVALGLSLLLLQLLEYTPLAAWLLQRRQRAPLPAGEPG